MTDALKKLEAVLCGQDGRCCISGSDADRAIVDEALEALRQQEVAAPVGLTDDATVDLVKEAGLDWHAGFNLDDENRYGTLVRLAFNLGAASRAPGASVAEPEHWDNLRKRGWRQHDCKVCGESWGAMSEPETPPMAGGAGGSVGASREQDSFHVVNAESSRVQGAGPVDPPCGHMLRGVRKWYCERCQRAATGKTNGGAA